MRKNRDSDIEIIVRIREGDSSQFRKLVDKYKDLSFSLACSILKNEQDAEDALQDAFLKAFRNLGKFRFKSEFSTWFYRIVVNTCNTRLRQRNRLGSAEEVNEIDELNSEDSQAIEGLEEAERKELINKMLAKLTPEEELLIRLYYMAELSVKEIIKVTGFGSSKVKVTLYRARKSLQSKLSRYYVNEMEVL